MRGCARVSIAVLTMYDGSHAYGKDTLKGIFARLLRGLPSGDTTAKTTSGRPDSNRGPQAPKACALTRLRYAPTVTASLEPVSALALSGAGAPRARAASIATVE